VLNFRRFFHFTCLFLLNLIEPVIHRKIQSLVVRRARRCVNCFQHNFVVQKILRFYLYGKTIPECYEIDAEGNQGISNKQLALTFRQV